MKKVLFLFAIMSMFVSSCSKDKDDEGMDNNTLKVEQTEFHLYVGESATIVSNAINPIFSIENKYYAAVSEDGVISAKFVGETEITISAENGQENIRIYIEPQYTYFNEPLMEWGATEEVIIDKYGQPDYRKNNWLGYYGSTIGENYTICFYKITDIGLESCSVIFDGCSLMSYVTIELHISERYRKVKAQVPVGYECYDLRGGRILSGTLSYDIINEKCEIDYSSFNGYWPPPKDY